MKSIDPNAIHDLPRRTATVGSQFVDADAKHLHRLAVSLGLLLACTGPVLAGPEDPPPPIPVFEADAFGLTPFEIDNPYLPLAEGDVLVYEGETEDGLERIIVVVSEETRVVLGVECRVVIDRGFVDGELVEETFDWFAQDLEGNVWYFGEDSREIEDGEVVSTEGSWEAGIDGALPGILMPAIPSVGDSYRQEYYEGEAEDMAEVVALDAVVTLSDGTVYSNVLQTLEWTPLEPDALENKYYVPGLGLVREENADGDEPIDLVGDAWPLKETKLIIEHNATDEDTGFQGFIDGEGWQMLVVSDAEGGQVLTFEALDELGDLGLTELFFETVEPENATVPIDDMLAKLAEGKYLVIGPTQQDGESEGDTAGNALLTHQIPAGPELLTPEEDASVDASQAVAFSWLPVSEDLDGEPVEIIAYQLIVERDAPEHPHMIGKPGFSAYLPATVTRVVLPEGILEPDSNYEWEVLAIESSGNQTLSSGGFDTGEAPDPGEDPEEDPPQLKAAKLIIEHNATDEDTGFQGFIDSEGWQSLEVTDPEGTMVLRFQAHGVLGELGMTELFFETVEPENAEVPIADMLAKLPAGNYAVAGLSIQNGESGGQTSGMAFLTHTIPAGPELLEPEEGAIVPVEGVTLRWSPVTEALDGGPVTIIAYQLIVEEDLPSHPHQIGSPGLSIYLPPDVTSVTLPGELLAAGREYEWEVLAIEESGNQTISSSVFTTELPLRLSLTEDGQLSWPAISGEIYEIEATRELGPNAQWTVVGQVEADDDGITYDLSAIMAEQAQSYFRVQQKGL
jgi:hypothetical protein